MNYAQQEIVIDSDDDDVVFSDEEFQEEAQPETMDYTIEAIDKTTVMEIEERIPYDTKVIRNRNKKSRLIEEMMIEEMDIQNEQYVLKKVKTGSKEKGKVTPQDNADNSKTTNLSEMESEVLQSDIPERLQRLYGSRPRKIPQEELEVEAKWIARKLERKKKLSLDNDPDPLVSQVFTALDLMKNQYYEVMYIYTYKFNEMVDLTLEDLWFIQNRDAEWIQMQQKKLRLVKESEDKITHEQTQSYIENLIVKTFDEYTLENISGYIQYKELSINPKNSTLQLPVIAGLNIHELYADKELKEAIFACIADIFLTPEDFAFNLKHNNMIRVPKSIHQRPGDYYKSKKNLILVEENNPFTGNMMSFFQTVTFLMAYELFFHPLVKAFARRIYHEKVKISTRPKPTSNEDVAEKMDIYQPDYCVKRIRNRPFTQFKADETGIFLLKNTAEGKIDMCFHTSDESINIFDLTALSPDKDGMLKHLVKHFISQENDDLCTSEWNLIRKECINFLVHHLLYPHLQKELEKDILETSEKAVINSCADRLKFIINNGQCISPQDGKSFSNVISIVLTEGKEILAVAIDRDGLYQDSSPKFSFDPFKMLNSQQTIDNVGSSKKEEYHKLGEFIFKYRPELIVLGDYKISRRVIRKIVRDFEDTPYSEDLSRNIIYSSPEIPKLLLDAPKNLIWNQFENAELDQDQRIAINLGRMQQDALCEVAKLWSNQIEENQLLKVLSHDLQSYVHRQNLMHRYEEVLIETVNRNGVDLNQMLQCTHRSSTLQFVCGLGPIKAQYFIGIAMEKQTKVIKQRNFIFRYEKGCFQDKIFWNASGFIKIEPPKGEEYNDEYKPLDQTRIHPSWYGLAKKIEKDTFEEIPESLNNVLEKASRYPDLLKEVDIEDFASHLEQSKGMKNMKPVLEFIISELINPFKKYRRQFSEWNQEYLYFKMTGLCSFYCQIGAMVQGIITKVDKTFISVRLETGIECAVYKYEVFDKDISNDLTKEFYEGQGIVARIVNLTYEHFKTDFSSLVKINLSLKPGVLNNHKNYILAIHPNLDEFNIMDPNDDYPVLISNKRKKTNFIDRMIMHNKFKNITADEAIDLLDEKDVGEVLFRPGKRTDQIYITWKFYDHMYIHVEIHEGPKLNHEPLSKKLTINKKTFSSLNEIIAHYIQPCNKFVKTVSQHPKFFRGDVNTIRQQLQMEKEAEPKYIPYHILFSKDAPQHALLCYLKNSQLETEYIKIDGSGYWFHDALFIVFEELIRYFKMNQSKPDYINYVHSTKKPFVEVIPDDDEEVLPSSLINSGFGIETIKWKDMNKVTLEEIDKVPDQDSIKVKQEKRPPMLCENCGVRGHSANQCPVSNDRPRRGDFENKRGGWNNRDENSGSGGKGGWPGSSKGLEQDSWGAPASDDLWGGSGGMQVEPKEKTNSAEKNQGGWGQSSSWGNNTSSWGSSEGKEKSTPTWGSSTGNKWGGSGEAEKESGSTGWGNSSGSGWGARRDDGDQKPRGKGCFKCGEEGHMSRDCPNPRKDDGDRPRSKGCFKCGEEGHMARDCTNPRKEGGGDSDRPRSKGCFKCGEEGHMSRDCPNPGDSQRKMTCFRCGEEGHSAKGCTNPRKEGADPRGSWKPRDSNADSSDRPSRGWGSTGGSGGGWGSTSGSGWGSSANTSDSSGQITDTWGSGANKSQENKSSGWGTGNTDTWGSGTNRSQENKSSGWGSGNTDSWGVQKGDSWGTRTQEKKGKMEVESSGGWGSSSKPETKASTGDSWGVNDTWGSGFAKPEPKKTVADSWGSASAGSLGDSSKSDAKATGDTWGAPAVSAWGDSSKSESKSVAGDTWGQGAPKETMSVSPEKSWSAQDTWGEPAKADTKTTANDTWGASGASNSWGETSKTETKTTANDTWGTPAASSAETKHTETGSWGASGGNTWGDSSQKDKTGDSWGTSSWGAQKSNEQSSSANAWGESKSSVWGASGNSSWGKSSDEKAESGGWGKSGTSSWGRSGDDSGNGNGERKTSWQGGRRDDGDSRPRSKGCFKCGEEGHISRDCPNPRKEDGDRPRGRGGACFKCGEEGHMARDCTNPRKEGGDNDRPRSKGCYKCGEEGHMSRDCPNPGEKPRKLTCFRCGEEGHGARGCTNPRKEGADPRGSWKPRDSNNGDPDRTNRDWRRGKDSSRSRSRSREKESRTNAGSWGSKSGEKGDSGWGKSSIDWGNSGSTDSWGKAANSGHSNTNDTWGNPSGNDSAKKNDGWGSNDTWGSKQDQTSKSDSWGASNDNKGGWGTTSTEPKDNSGNWGTATSETKSNSGGWGKAASEVKDGWGTMTTEEKDNSGNWGNTTTETKNNSINLGTTISEVKDSWGTMATEEKDNSGNWGAKTSETKDNTGGWGAATSETKDNSGNLGTATSEAKDNSGEWAVTTSEVKDNSGGWGAAASETKDNAGEGVATTPEAKVSNDGWGTVTSEVKDDAGELEESAPKDDQQNPRENDLGPSSENKEDNWEANPSDDKTQENNQGDWGVPSAENKADNDGAEPASQVGDNKEKENMEEEKEEEEEEEGQIGTWDNEKEEKSSENDEEKEESGSHKNDAEGQNQQTNEGSGFDDNWEF